MNIEPTHCIREIEHASHVGVHGITVPTHLEVFTGVQCWGGGDITRSILIQSGFPVHNRFAGFLDRRLKSSLGAVDFIPSCLGLDCQVSNYALEIRVTKSVPEMFSQHL